MEIELITGKTHQIRAHLAAYGHPIVGDGKYCNPTIATNKTNFKTSNTNKKNSTDKNYPKYQLLHAYRIVFPLLEGELAYLSNKEFICEEPKVFHKFRDTYFMN